MEIITRNEKILYIGIDVHKDTYSLCCFDFFRNELSDEMTIKATTKAVIKYLETIRKKHTEKFFKWIKTVQFSEKWMQEALNEYLAEVYSLKHKIELMDTKIREIAELEIVKDKVDKLICFSGIDVNLDVIPDFFELQVKTLFQHAWSQAEHDLRYKGNGKLSFDDKRMLSFAAAQAWGADKVFEGIFKRQENCDK